MADEIGKLPDSPQARQVWRRFAEVEESFRETGCPICGEEAVNFYDEGGDGGFELRHVKGCPWGDLHVAIYGERVIEEVCK